MAVERTNSRAQAIRRRCLSQIAKSCIASPKNDRETRRKTYEPEARAELVRLIDCFEDDLENPTPDDIAHGWDEERRAVVRETVTEWRERLSNPDPVSRREKRPSIARDLSDIGISGGPLLDRISIIGNFYWDADLDERE